MSTGGGRYEDLCTYVRTRAQADGAIVMVFGGCRGSGFSIQASADVLLSLPALLRQMAGDIECDVAVLPIGSSITPAAADSLICGGCGRHLGTADMHVLPGTPQQVRCSRCVGEEASHG